MEKAFSSLYLLRRALCDGAEFYQNGPRSMTISNQ